MKKNENNTFIGISGHYKILNNDQYHSGESMSHVNQLLPDGSTNPVYISNKYIKSHCESASYYYQTIIVGKENKYWTTKQVKEWIQENEHDLEFDLDKFIATAPRVGDLKVKGIREVFKDIRDKTPFTVIFQKADKKKTKKAYQAEIEERVQKFMQPVLKAKTSKKSMEEAARESVVELIENPVLNYIPGEMRTLVGYKLQFQSKDGHYRVFDLEIQNKRLVNIKTIQELIYNGVKYTLE